VVKIRHTLKRYYSGELVNCIEHYFWYFKTSDLNNHCYLIRKVFSGRLYPCLNFHFQFYLNCIKLILSLFSENIKVALFKNLLLNQKMSIFQCRIWTVQNYEFSENCFFL